MLTYPGTADFDFVGVTGVHTSLSTMTVQQLTDGKLTLSLGKCDTRNADTSRGRYHGVYP